MRGVVALGLVVAGCYAPTFAPGAPCVAGSSCPDNQICTLVAGDYRCEPSASPDDAHVIDGTRPDVANPDQDDDGDGVLNAVDNCPENANADQHDEDHDGYGDVCDPCPVTANAVESDMDGDGVGDTCDPNPAVMGDKIYLFESFKNGVPGGAQWDVFGVWTGAGDSVSVSAIANHADLALRMPTTGKETIWTQVTITAVGSGTTSVGAIDEKGANGTDGISCDLRMENNPTNLKLALTHANTAGGAKFSDTQMAWAVGSRYPLVFSRDGSAYTCVSGAFATNGTNSTTNSPPESGLWLANAAATFDYLLIVTSP